MPYLLFLLGGVCVGLSRGGRGVWTPMLAGILIGLGGYFKGLDASVAACAFGVFMMGRREGGVKDRIWPGLAVPAAAFLVLVPLCAYTYSVSGSFTPGSKGRGNLALGPGWSDSKIVYSAEGRKWEEASSADLIRQIPKRIGPNVAETLRIFNAQIFVRGFRMGTMWFSLLLLTCLAVLWKHRLHPMILLPLCMSIMQLMLLWIVFVHDRLLLPTLPWVLLALLAVMHQADGWSAGWRKRMAWGLVLLIYLGVNARYAVDVSSRAIHRKTVECARILRQFGGTDRDVVMSYGPDLAVEFNATNPLKTVGIPYGTIEQVEEIANRHQVRFIVVSDTSRNHWPIARLFDPGVSAPANWILLTELDYREELWPGGTRVGERLRLYERRPSGELRDSAS